MKIEKPYSSPQAPTNNSYFKIIKSLKVNEITIVLLAISIILYILIYIGSLKGASSFFIFFTRKPIPAICDVCLASSIIGFTFERFVRKEADAALQEMISNSLNNQSTNLLNEIPKVLLLGRDIQQNLFKNSKIEEIILNALQSRFNEELGKGIYNGLICKAIDYEERWSNYRFEIYVEDIINKEASECERNEFFDVTMKISYYTYLRKTNFTFVCINPNIFNDYFRDPSYEVVWFMTSSGIYPTPNSNCFNVMEVNVEGNPLGLLQENESDGMYELKFHDESLEKKINNKVKVSYTFKVKAKRLGHLIATTVKYPTHDVLIDFYYAKSSINSVSVLDYFVSANKPEISYLPTEENPSKVSVHLKDEWAFPKGGAIFVWRLNEEIELLH